MGNLGLNIRAFGALVAIFATSGVAQAQTVHQVATRSTVVVECDGGHGTGFVIRHQGGDAVVTNRHVAEGCDGMRLRYQSGQTQAVHAVYASSRLDLAVLLPEGQRAHAPALTLSSAEAVPGEEVVVAGHPQSLRWQATSGRVTGFQADASCGDDNCVVLDAQAMEGNSGGPVVNAHRHVVGVVFATTRTRSSLTFAIPSRTLQRELAQARDELTELRATGGTNIEPEGPVCVDGTDCVARGALIAEAFQEMPEFVYAAAGTYYAHGCITYAYAPACFELAQAAMAVPANVATREVAFLAYGRACGDQNYEDRGRACTAMGNVMMEGAALASSPEDAIEWFQLGCNEGDNDGCIAAGRLYERALSSLDHARRYFAVACVNGAEEACEDFRRTER